MTSYEFTLRLNREVTEDEVEALYKAGCGDAGVETGPQGTVIEFDREAPNLATAIASAVRDVEKIPGLRAVGLACEELVTLLDIAQRVSLSREAVRLWSTGQRGPGDFPTPVVTTSGGERLWDWREVSKWLRRRPELEMFAEETHIMITANLVLRTREALVSEPDESVREEFERLLEDA